MLCKSCNSQLLYASELLIMQAYTSSIAWRQTKAAVDQEQGSNQRAHSHLYEFHCSQKVSEAGELLYASEL